MAGHQHASQLPLERLVDWLHEADRHAQCHSLVLASTGTPALHEVAFSVAAYLNEFDGHGGSHWRTFDSDLLHQLAEDPVSRDLVLAAAPASPNRHKDGPDLDRIARNLASLGGVILIGRRSSQATSDLESTFHVHLCPDDPPVHRRYHMWVNPVRFSRESLVCVIADSFLDWTCQGGLSESAHPSSAESISGLEHTSERDWL